MISASCPSCGNGISFAHAASLTVVCASCRSCVTRTDLDLTVLGTVSAFGRELSPIQLGSSGEDGGRGFRVVGVLRKGRDRVRWNEFFLAYDDGLYGWLSDGNGCFQLFEHRPVQALLPDPAGLPANARLTVEDVEWRVVESAQATILAAEGELPFPVAPAEPTTYCDLKSARGRVATLDKDGAGRILLWIGRVVDLPKLKMQGLRPFLGFSDESLVRFHGPEIDATRTLSCPSCRAPLEMRSGNAAKIVCGYCASELGASEQGGGVALAVLDRQREIGFQPELPLGAFGTLDGAKWAVIGAMSKSDGGDWPWVEYLLWNPYRGTRWLVQDYAGHWSLVDAVHDLPDAPDRMARWRGQGYRIFWTGTPQVDGVLGEFYWEVHRGDAVVAGDFVAPPQVLSVERSQGEITWSVGRWMSVPDVRAAFACAGIRPSSGVAPHQPNPYGEPAARKLHGTMVAVLLALVVLIWGGKNLVFPSATVVNQAWIPEPVAQNVWISDAFELPGGLRADLAMLGRTTVSPREGSLHVALIGLDAGRAWLPSASRKVKGPEVLLSAYLNRAPAGRYVARVELAAAPGEEASLAYERVELRVQTRPTWSLPLFLALGTCLFFFVFRYLGYSSFEGRRWAESDADPAMLPTREIRR